MTRTDRDLVRGWQAAQRGLPPEPHEPQEFHEGYAIWLETARRRRLERAIANLRIQSTRH